MCSRLAGLLIVAASLAATHTASAADMPIKAPIFKAPPVASTNWTGFYLNGGWGYGVWSADTTTQSPLGLGCSFVTLCVDQVQGGKGWLGVIGIGYDYQATSNIVVGAFADFNFASLKGTIQDQLPFFAGDIKEQWAWAVGARAGWLFTPDFLAYVNGGYTSARFSGANMTTSFAGAPTGFSTPPTTFQGWFLGIGSESAMHSILGLQLGPGWFWRNEYRYAAYDSKTLPDTSGAAFASNINFKPTVQTVTTQAVYKINADGPIYRTPAPPPANWNGIYVNGGLGYGAWAADTTTLSPATGACILCQIQVQGGKGWLGVIGVGYDYQATSNIVVGAFADFNFANLKGTIQDQFPFFAGDIKEQWAWAAGPRAGWLLTPQLLSYVNGGYTSARLSGANIINTNSGASSGFGTPATTFHGWFLGGGFEAAITPNLFWRNEYRLARYNSETIPDTNGALTASSITFKPTVQTITSQLVYKFNFWR